MAGNQQAGSAGQPLATPLALRVKDALGNAVPGVAVQFTASGTGSIEGSGLFDASGRIEARSTLGGDGKTP